MHANLTFTILLFFLQIVLGISLVILDIKSGNYNFPFRLPQDKEWFGIVLYFLGLIMWIVLYFMLLAFHVAPRK